MMQDVSGYANRGGLRLLIVGALIAISGRCAAGQICSISVAPADIQPFMAAPSEKMPAYEVATIKPGQLNVPGGRGVALRIYIQQAFGVSPNIAGSIIGPDWINSTRYVIQGKAPDSIRDAMQTMSPADRMKENDLMMQSLLADRFQLKAHFETREMPMYELVLAKGGSKLTEDSDPTKRQVASGGTVIRAGAAPIRLLTDVLECAPDVGGREVVDKTGLTGTYDISLKWTPLQTGAAAGGGSGSPPPPDAPPDIFTAIQEQLGLKLVPTKGQGQVLIIDHIEQPSAN